MQRKRAAAAGRQAGCATRRRGTLLILC